jgi:hypothetical protein
MNAFIVVWVLLGAFSIAQAAETDCRAGKGTGTFSNLALHRETGDLLGLEVHIVLASDENSRRIYKAMFQMAEGGPGNVTLSPVTLRGCHFTVVISEMRADEVVRVEGEIHATYMEGKLIFKAGHSDGFRLQRRRSYWD